ncbi:MAG TPA: pseudouridine synthase, partial [Mesorhizobium sp.]
MDDNDKKYPRKSGPKPAGPRARSAGAAQDRKPGGKPAFGAKKPFVKRDGPNKPYAPRGDRPAAADGERPKRDFAPRGGGEAERPRSEFKREYKPREPGEAPRGERTFNKGPRPEGKPFVKRDGPRKPYAPRGDRPAAAEGERGERRFDRPKRDDAPGFGRDSGRSGQSGGSSSGFKPRPRPADAAEEAGERIAKRLARAGLASRRDAEELIEAGRVKVNGKVLASPAFNVMPGDIIHLDGMEIPPIERTRLFLFHKPAGVVTTNRDPEGRKTVFDVLPADLPRLMTIGRLDINTEGLLLLTNDGGLSRVLELPATGWLRRYRVRVHGKVEESALTGLREGIAVDGVFYGAIEATLDREQGSNAWLTLALREGKNREVRNILGSLGLDVTRLIRIS